MQLFWWDLHCREMPLAIWTSESAEGTSRPSFASTTTLWDAAADGKCAHVIQKASLFGPVFSFPFPAAQRACVGLAGRLLLCKAPLLATASIPLPCLLRESANICSEFSTCSEVHLGTLGYVRRLRVEVKAPSISGFSLSLFLGITSKQPFCSLPSLATHPILSFLERVQIGEELC